MQILNYSGKIILRTASARSFSAIELLSLYVWHHLRRAKIKTVVLDFDSYRLLLGTSGRKLDNFVEFSESPALVET